MNEEEGKMNDLTLLGFRYGTDKSYFHRYTEAYEDWLLPLRQDVRQVVEIGIYNGASLRMWRDYFPNALVLGADIDPATFVHNEHRIKSYFVDQSQRKSLQQLEGSFEGDVDLFIDDGSHQSGHQMLTLGYFLPRMKVGGIFILEDLQTSLEDTSQKSAYATIKNWIDGKLFTTPHLTNAECMLINKDKYEFKLYSRDKQPFMCWRCKQPPMKCTCGFDYVKEPGSSITLMIRKLAK